MGVTNPILDNLEMFPSASNWCDPRAGGHAVQFFKDDQFLVCALARFIGTAIVCGDAGLIIATPDHREALRERLHSRGLDLAVAVDDNRYIELDAAETLSKFMVNGWPDVTLFMELMGKTIGTVGKSTPNIAAFGEMVALLWAQEKFEAAVRLEQLWNALAQAHDFTLRCAYPIGGFQRDGFGERLRNVCKEHSCVFPSDGYL